jgi:hypothetical protein
MVHGAGRRPLHPYFHDVAAAGGIVCRVPSYRKRPDGVDYPPRNAAGTLLHAADFTEREGDVFVLCETDFLFLGPLHFPTTLAADYYNYLDYREEPVRAAARRFGLDPAELEARHDELRCGVPYVVPAPAARALAEAWLAAIDVFDPGLWVISMYAFAFAAAKLGLRVEPVRLMTTNYSSDAPAGPGIIHYGYGDARWDKRNYVTPEQVPHVWSPTDEGEPGTVLAELTRQLREASAFYAHAAPPTDTADTA